MGTAYILTVEGRMVGVFTRLDLLEEAKDTTPEVSEVELDPQFGKPGLRLYQAMVSCSQARARAKRKQLRSQQERARARQETFRMRTEVGRGQQ